MDRSPSAVPQFLATATLAAALLALSPPAHAGFGGPDPYGYTWIDSNELAGPDFDWLPTTTGHTINAGSWIGFVLNVPFEIYGTRYTTLYVGEDMILSFGGGPTDGDNVCLGDPAGNPNFNRTFIAALWDD